MAPRVVRPEAVEETAPEETVEENYVPPVDPSPGEDIERLLPGPSDPVTLESGTKVLVNPLKLREFLAMLKIVTRGAALALGQVRLNTNDEDFMQSMMGLFLFAIPEADDEACDFIRVMVKPYGDFKTPEELRAAQEALDAELENPDLEDLFTVIEIVITREGSDLRRLGKRLTNALEFARKTGQV